MRTMLRPALFALMGTTILAGGVAAQGGPRLAYVNTQAVLAEAPGRAEAEKRFESEMAGFRNQIKLMGDSLNTMIAEFSKVEPTLSAADRETRAGTIRQRQEQYQQRAAQFEEQAQKQQLAYFQPIMQQIEGILGQIRREDGYALIFDVGGNAAPIVAADTTLDITRQVITRLKAAPPAAAVPAATTPAGPVAQPSGASTRPRTP